MSRRGSGPVRRPLWRRITVGLVVLVAVVLVVVGAVTLGVLRSFLLDQVDRQLAQTAAQIQGRTFGDLQGLAVGTLLVESDGQGRVTRTPILVVPSQESGGSVTLSEGDLEVLVGVGRTPSDVRLSDLGHYRALQVTDERGDHVTVGLPLHPVDETLATLLAVEVAALVGALLTVALVGAWLVRRDLAPLGRVADTARRVASLPLSSGQSRIDDRVPIEAAGSEVGEMAEAFNEMLDHVGASFDARAATEARLRRFVADASHELRTPLVSIRGYAELFRRSDDDPEQRRVAMARIESESVRMGVLVDDLLLLARLDQGRPLRHEPVDVARLAADAASDAQVADPTHPISLDVPAEPTYVVGDPDRLQQVLVNLLANVRLHTPAGTRATVAVAAGGPTVRLSVVDDGPGIPAGFQAKAFERFARADQSRSRASGGTGLGLSIVAAVVAALGGRVELSSRPGRTEVVVELPAAGEQLEGPAGPETSRDSSAPAGGAGAAAQPQRG